MALEGVSFNWKVEDFPDRGFSRGRQIGLIAQDVEGVLPELVQTDGEGHEAVEYQKMVAV
jgi:hypothetical protein